MISKSIICLPSGKKKKKDLQNRASAEEERGEQSPFMMSETSDQTALCCISQMCEMFWVNLPEKKSSQWDFFGWQVLLQVWEEKMEKKKDLLFI